MHQIEDITKIGIIGGSGVYDMDELTIVDEKDIDTPFGKPSDKILIGKFGDGANIAFLPRHGKGHRILPTEVNSQANIWALKSIGVKKIIGVSAVGSLIEDIAPGDIVLPDQIIDRTRSRVNTYFGNGIVGHVSFAEPFCNRLRDEIIKEVKDLGYKMHEKGTYICMEGPLFSTKAESHLYRSWNASVIGMTALPEAKLAREAEMCYAIIALSTDYDCWRESEEAVTLEMILETMKQNVIKAKQIVKNIVYKLLDDFDCSCNSAAKFSIMTDKSLIPDETKEKLSLFYGDYWK